MKTWREGSRTWNLCGVHWASKRGVFVRIDITGTVNSFYLEFSSSFFRFGFLFFRCFSLFWKFLFLCFLCFVAFLRKEGGGGISVLYFIGQFLFLTLTLVSVSRVVVNTGWNVIYQCQTEYTGKIFLKKVYLRQTLVYTSHLQLFRSWAQLPKPTDTLESAYCAYVLSNCRRIVQRLVWIIQFVFATRWWNSGEGGGVMKKKRCFLMFV